VGAGDRGDRRPAALAHLGDAGVYRRRWRNVARKSGNVEDFVSRWGGRYDHMIVLDADSLIDASTLMRLVQMMHADPALAFCRPRRSDRRAQLFGRLQQFAACAYGPVITPRAGGLVG